MKNLCAACGKPLTKGGIGLGGTLICRQCEPAVSAEIASIRAQGKPVNAAHIAHRIYKEAHSGGNYLIRDIPADLWDRAKHRAVDDGVSLRELVLLALESYLN
jgi:hypothetical protein